MSTRTCKRLLLATALVVLFGIGIHHVLPRLITQIRPPWTDAHRESKESKAFRKVYFQSFDGLTLAANLYPSDHSSPNGTILFLHGIRSKKEHFDQLARNMNALGFHAVALDARAHGESEGHHCTFGVKEKRDVSALINHLEASESLGANIGVWGQSLGGAIALQAMAHDERIKFGIVESTFSDFKQVAEDYIEYHTGIRSGGISNYLIERAADIAEFDPSQARPLKACANIQHPVLLVHGDLDQRINIKYAQENYGKLQEDRSIFYEVKGANHLNVWEKGGEAYMQTVLEFLLSSSSDD